MEGQQSVSILTNPELWVSLSFVIFLALFGRTLWQKLTGILDQRSHAVQSELDEANRLKMEATAMLADAQARRETALKEAAELLQSAHQEAERVAAQARTDALESARRRERIALDRIALAERQAMIAMRQLAADTAINVTKQIIEAGIPPEANNRLIDQAIADMPMNLAASYAH